MNVRVDLRMDSGWRNGVVENWSLVATLVVLLTVSVVGQVKSKPEIADHEKPLLKTGAIDKRYAVLNINNISSWMRYDGHSNHSPSADDGTYYPRQTGSVIYQDCLVWGGKAFLDAAHTQPAPRQLVRVGGGTYSVATRAGRIIDPVFGSAVGIGVEDQNAADVKTYRIRRDYYTMSWSEAQEDGGSLYELPPSYVSSTMVAELMANYASDWSNWPVAKGAPFIDRNGNGVYDPPPAFNNDPLDAIPDFTVDSLIAQGRDEPGVAGADFSLPADQVIWTVYNDLNVSTATSFEGSEPLGLEVQKTMWGYRRTDAFGSMYFTRYRMINKGGVDTDTTAGDQFGAFWIDSMYVAQWSDPDLGNAGDDLVGCDSVLSLGFCYNGNAIDAEFRGFNLPPPAVGYDFLAGPTVPSPGDSAIVDFRRRMDRRNLPMSAFAYFSAGSPYSDPPPGLAYYLVGTGRWWKMLRGFAPLGDLNTVDQPYNHPSQFPASKFPYSGNPVTGQGWIDGQSYGTLDNLAGDRRIILSSGPFSLAPNDTQEVYMSVVAGLGGDRLSSIAVMKYNDRFVQSAFDRLYAVPRAPQVPTLQVSALDREIVLNWGSDQASVRRAETVPSSGLVFEGYNVYELPSATSPVSDGVKIATFDLVNEVARINETRPDPATGFPLTVILQSGSNTGIQRSVNVTRSYLVDQTRGELLTNGKEYHFAVTTYNWNPVSDDLPRSLESVPVIVSVKPRIPFGESPVTSSGDTLPVTHTSGTSNARVVPLVVDPLAGSGATYRVSFQLVGATPTWQITNVLTGAVVAEGQTNLSGDESYPIVDGTLVKVMIEGGYGLRPGAWGLGDGTSFNQGARMLSWVAGDGLGLEEFNGAAGWTAPAVLFGSSSTKPVVGTNLKKILFRFAHHGASTGYDFLQATDDTASYAYRFLRDAAIAPVQPSFAPWIVNPGSGWPFQDYRISMPLAAYDVDENPPVRLAVAFSENNATNGLVDGYYWPGYINAMPGGMSNTAYDGPMEWLYVMNSPYAGATPNTAWQNVLTDAAIPVMYTFTWNRRTLNPWVPPIEAEFTPVRAPSTDMYEFIIPGPGRTTADVNAGIERIGVYPNPYLGDREQISSALEQSVTFTNLPPRAIVRIFNLAGHLVRTLHKDTPSQFFNWDLLNENGWIVASGMYICLVELPDLGRSKVLKLGVVIGESIPGNGY